MKKILYTFALVILLSTIANAGINSNGNYLPLVPQAENNSITANPVDMVPYAPASINKGDKLQADSATFYFNNLATVEMGGETMGIAAYYHGSNQSYGNNTSPVAYDPISNCLVYAACMSTDTDKEARIFYSMDLGKSWEFEVFAKDPELLPVSPSIGVLNRNDSKSYDDLDIAFYSITIDFEAGAYTPPNIFWRIDGEKDEYKNIKFDDGKNKSAYSMGRANLLAYDLDGSPVITTVSSAFRNAGETVAGGVYGQFTFDLGEFDYFTSIPNAWDVTQFRPAPNPSEGSSYSSKMFNDVDEEGDIYAGVMNYFVNEDDSELRMPAVSKSADLGNSWDDFNHCPNSALKEFAAANDGLVLWPDGYDDAGEDIWLINEAYGRYGFVVTGVDKYSFVTKFNLWFVRNDSLLRNTILAEIYYGNESWGVRKIADYSNNYKMHITYDRTSAQFRGADDRDGADICVAKTTDGSMVVTWTSATEKNQVYKTPLEFSMFNRNTGAWDANYSVDSLAQVDIFAAYRSLDGGAWIAKQFTDDDYTNKMVRMPRAIPDVYNIPVIGHYTWLAANDPMENYEFLKKHMRTDAFTMIYALQLDFNKHKKYHINVTSVEDDKTSIENLVNFTLNAPVPNPATNMTELTFKMGENAYTTIELFDAIGNKVKTLQAGQTSVGIHGINVNTTDLASGTYFIILTANGNKQTQILKVIR